MGKNLTNLLTFTTYWNEEPLEDDTRAVAKKMQNLCKCYQRRKQSIYAMLERSC